MKIRQPLEFAALAGMARLTPYFEVPFEGSGSVLRRGPCAV